MSSGERKRKSPNRGACTAGFGLQTLSDELVEWHWKDHPESVKDAYTKAKRRQQYPEYIGTRGTLMEYGGTTL